MYTFGRLVNFYRLGHVASSVASRELVHAVSLGERVGWGISLVRSKTESIHPALDDFPDQCTEPKRVVKFVNNPEGTCPSES